MERRFVKVEKGLGPQGRIAVVRFDRGDNINALSQQAMRELRDVPRDFEDDLETSVVILTGSAKAFSAGFDLKDPESRQREGSADRRAHPAPAARPQNVQGLAGHGPGDDRGDRGPLHRWRCRIGGIARLPLLREGRALPHSRGRARHEHELGLDPTHAGVDGAGAHQAGGDPGVGSHKCRRRARLGPGREDGRRRPGAGRVDGVRRAHRAAAADPGAHEQGVGQSPRARPRRSRRAHGRRPERADRTDRGLQGGDDGVSREAQAPVQGRAS